jgi:hypothetical protein
MTTATRTRRTEAERIEALEAQIQRLKSRAEAKKVRRDPALKHVLGAVRWIDKALSATGDPATRKGLDEARATLTACLALHGVAPKASVAPELPRASANHHVDPDALLAHVQAHPGQRGEEIAAAFATDARTMRPVMHRLIDSRKIRTRGQRRGMTYHPV